MRGSRKQYIGPTRAESRSSGHPHRQRSQFGRLPKRLLGSSACHPKLGQSKAPDSARSAEEAAGRDKIAPRRQGLRCEAFLRASCCLGPFAEPTAIPRRSAGCARNTDVRTRLALLDASCDETVARKARLRASKSRAGLSRGLLLGHAPPPRRSPVSSRPRIPAVSTTPWLSRPDRCTPRFHQNYG